VSAADIGRTIQPCVKGLGYSDNPTSYL
jgi:hypothetical protein